MFKEKFSITCDRDTIEAIDKVAKQNKMSRSAISRMLLQMIYYLPAERLKEITPVPSILGLEQKRNLQ